MKNKFSELNKFRESDKSGKHELESILKSFISHVSCWCCGSILIFVVGLNPFTVMTNNFVTEFAEFSENI